MSPTFVALPGLFVSSVLHHLPSLAQGLNPGEAIAEIKRMLATVWANETYVLCRVQCTVLLCVDMYVTMLTWFNGRCIMSWHCDLVAIHIALKISHQIKQWPWLHIIIRTYMYAGMIWETTLANDWFERISRRFGPIRGLLQWIWHMQNWNGRLDMHQQQELKAGNKCVSK